MFSSTQLLQRPEKGDQRSQRTSKNEQIEANGSEKVSCARYQEKDPTFPPRQLTTKARASTGGRRNRPHLLELLEGVGASGRPSTERVAGGVGEPERPPARVLLHRRDVLRLRRAQLLLLTAPASRGGGEEVGGSRGSGELTEDAPHGGGASCVAGAVTGGKAVAREGREGGRGKLREMGDRLINPTCDTDASLGDGRRFVCMNNYSYEYIYVYIIFINIFERLSRFDLKIYEVSH
jgi:hypothetical protein